MNFEIAILKNLTASGEYFNKVFSTLEPGFFQSFETKKIFNLIKLYYTKYQTIPKITDVALMVKDVSDSEIRKNLALKLKEVQAVEPTTNLEFLLDETLSFIKDSLYVEALSIGAEGLQKKSDTLKQKAQAILDKRAKITFDDSIGLDFDSVDDMIEFFSKRNVGILSPHKELNKRLGPGFLPGTLSVILAAQSVGKSLMMCDLISGMLQQGKNILFVSLEMQEHEMMRRIYANVLDLDVNEFMDLSKTVGEKAMLGRPALTKDIIIKKYQDLQLSGQLGKLFVKDYPACSFGALQLESLVRKFQTEKNIKFDIIFIDYLGIMKSDLISQNAGLYSYLKSIGEEVRAAAARLGVAIVSASQLNRSAVNKTDDVDNSAISDSLGTAMTADFMLFLLQSEDMKTRSEIVCKVTKNRFNGRTDTWLMGVDYPKMRFFDLESTNGQSFKTPEDKTKADQYAKTEIKNIAMSDSKLVHTEKIDSIDDFLAEINV